MPLLQAKCTNCGADLKVDGAKDAAVCPYCGSAFVVEKAIANFYGSSVGSINASVVNIYGQEPKKADPVSTAIQEDKPIQPSKEYLRKFALAHNFDASVQDNLFLKSDGTLGIVPGVGGFGGKAGWPWLFNYRIFKWNNIKYFKMVVCTHDDWEEPYVYAITYDGKCYANTLYIQENRGVIPKETRDCFKIVRKWSGIVQLCHCSKGFAGLKKDGTVVSTWNDKELASWKNVKKLSLPGALTEDGRVLAFGVKDYQKRAYSQWTDIVDISGGSDGLRGLTKSGNLVQASIEEAMQVIDTNLYSLQYPMYNPDGSLSYRRWQGFHHKWEDEALKKLGKGYVISSGDYYLNQDGRVDVMLGDQIIREKYKDVVSIISTSFNRFSNRIYLLKPDGTLYSINPGIPKLKLLVGNPADYGRKVSHHVPDTETKQILIASYENMIKRCKEAKKYCGLFENKSRFNEKIDLCKEYISEIEKLP